MMPYRDVPPPRKPGVLIVDPTCEAGGAFVVGLEAGGWAVRLAADADADAAITTYALHAEEIDVALVDMQLPGLEGMRVLNRLREMNADLPCVATTSPVGPYAAAAFRRMCDTPLYTKPLDARCLSLTLFEMAAPVVRAKDEGVIQFRPLPVGRVHGARCRQDGGPRWKRLGPPLFHRRSSGARRRFSSKSDARGE